MLLSMPALHEPTGESLLAEPVVLDGRPPIAHTSESLTSTKQLPMPSKQSLTRSAPKP